MDAALWHPTRQRVQIPAGTSLCSCWDGVGEGARLGRKVCSVRRDMPFVVKPLLHPRSTAKMKCSEGCCLLPAGLTGSTRAKLPRVILIVVIIISGNAMMM